MSQDAYGDDPCSGSPPIAEIELQELLDGELAPERARAIEAHAVECPRCARFLAEERALAARVAELPRTIAARPDVWRAIEARIGEVPVRRVRWYEARGTKVAAGFALAAAAALALTLSYRGRPWGAPSGAHLASATSAPIPAPAPESTAPSTPRVVNAEEEPYLAALAALETDFVNAKNTLPPRSAQAVEHNLRILDAAIGTMREALSTQPDNLDLKSHLADIYQQKIHVEGDVIDLAARI